MEIGNINSVPATGQMQQGAPVTGGAPAIQPEETAKKEDSFIEGVKKNAGPLKSIALQTVVGAAVGAGVLALSGGSILAAIGFSTAICAGLGAIKGLAHAFLGSLNFGGHSGASSALDRNPLVMSLLMGGLGGVKGAAEGLVLGGLAATGFGPLGGAVAGAIMPSIEKLGWHMFEKHQSHNHGLRD